jgi:hypothetical protein
MGLQTIMWKYDSKDWQLGLNGVTKADIDGNYAQLIADLNAGRLNRNGAIILTHELNGFTMQEAIDWYPKLRKSFAVRKTSPSPRDPHTNILTNIYLSHTATLTVHRPIFCFFLF